MTRIPAAIFAMTILCLAGIGYIALVDWPKTSEVAGSPAPAAGITIDRLSVNRTMKESGGATSSDGSETVPESTEPVVSTAPLANGGESPLSGRGVAVASAEEQAARTSSPVHRDFERLVNEERVDYWAESAESLILDGINSAFGSAYSDWAVECRAAMCLTVANIGAETNNTQQFLPQGGWMDAMRTIHNDIAPVLPLLPMARQACIGIRRPVESGCWNYGGYGNPKERRDVSPRLAASRRRRDSE